MVPVRGKDVAVKKITVDDGTGKTQVSLWRDASAADCHTDDFVEITHVSVNFCKNEPSLTTTARSIIKICDAPMQTGCVNVEAVSAEETNSELLLDNNNIVTVPLQMLATAMGDKPVEKLTADGPVSIKMTKRGSDVLSVLLQTE